jgi:uncharacterized protein YdcH (DUF465 family)
LVELYDTLMPGAKGRVLDLSQGKGHDKRAQALPPSPVEIWAHVLPDHCRLQLIAGQLIMSNTPHTLADEFPGQMDTIHKLKVEDRHFARLLEEYDEVNDQVHRAETKVEPVDQLAEVELRKRRLMIKDAIAEALARAK